VPLRSALLFADARNVPKGTELETDLCIIGAGAAGITLARDFIGKQPRVTVLESGGLTFDERTQSLYKGRISGLPYFALDAARLRLFGGTTNHWGGDCRPFDVVDFEPRDWIPYSGWPIRKSDLQPFYDRAWKIVHLTSNDWDLRNWDERDPASPLDLDGRVLTRVVQVVNQSRRSFGTEYRNEIRKAQNVTCYLHANVTEIEADKTAKTATRVRVATLTGNRFALRARVFVLAVGGIENPRLLLASDKQKSRGLGNDHDLVGRFFLEHPRFEAGIVAPADSNFSVSFYQPHHVDQAVIECALALHPEIKRTERLVDVQIKLQPVYERGFLEATNSDDVAILKSLVKHARHKHLADHFGRHLTMVVEDVMTWHRFTIPGAPVPLPYPAVVEELIRAGPRDRRSLIPGLLGDIAAVGYQKLIGSVPIQNLTLTTRIEPAPNPDSRVSLLASRDEVGMRHVQLDWQLSPIDKESVKRTLEVLAAELGRAGLGRIKILDSVDNAGWPADLAGGWHHMGTTRMSSDPKRGVVDGNCRVHGMSNLFIAGSSVFSTAGSGTPTLTIVALTLRLSEHLKRTVL
jgi:choline dehydrogenase-like flavoprotein